MTLTPPSSHGTLTQGQATITPTQIGTLHSSPVTLVPAPASGYAIVPVSAMLTLPAGTVAYANNPDITFNPHGSAWTWLTASSFQFATATGVTAFSVAGNTSGALSAVNGLGLDIATTSNLFVLGALLTATVDVGFPGTGYAANDTGHVISPSGGTSAVYKVLTIGGGGAVLTVQITSGGTGFYTAADPSTTTVTTGAGDGALQLDTATITPQSNISLLVSFVYYVATV